jgi:hypothetical protein
METQVISRFQLAPLLTQQKRLWYLQQHSSAFWSQCTILIDGNLQPEILQDTIQAFIKKYEILITNFYCLPGVKTPVHLYLIRILDDQHILIVPPPALSADNRTIQNLVNQIAEGYDQSCQRKEVTVNYVQYVQFCELQNQLLTDEDAEAAQAY